MQKKFQDLIQKFFSDTDNFYAEGRAIIKCFQKFKRVF